MSSPAPLLYRCTVCDADWIYEAVRHIACCRACGGSLVRAEAAPPPVPPVPPRAPAVTPGRRVKRRGGRLTSPLPVR